MRTTEEILKEYECSDPGKRLHLFFGYRELREAFSDIEERGRHREMAKETPGKSYWQKLFSLMRMNSIYKIQWGGGCCGK